MADSATNASPAVALPPHLEHHFGHRVGWLRAAVLGANDGIVSTASLIVGVASAAADRSDVLIAGAAGLVAGAMSMAAGEYVSVSSQADVEQADLEKEAAHLSFDPGAEHLELADIYVARGVDPDIAHEVARQLMAHDALGAHARDELGISEIVRARPIQAAVTSAASFAGGAALPMITVLVAPASATSWWVGATSLVWLGALGAVAARTGGASALRGAARVTFWGMLAMVITALVGALVGTTL